MLNRVALTLAVLGGALACAPSHEHDIVIRGGTLFDGTGSPGIVGDIAIDLEYVFVNGVAVVSDGEYTGELPGRALRGPAYEP